VTNSTDFLELAGRAVIAGFDGTSLPADVASLLARGALGGIALFGRNLEGAAQAAALIGAARSSAPRERPPIVAVDQEGGRVARLKEPLAVLPPARSVAAAGDPGLTTELGRLVGLELAALGFTLDFAPVLDVDTNPASPVIGDRAFGCEPDAVIRHGLAFARGLRDGGVLPCAKHFPGHGDAALDSHLALPRVEFSAERLRAVEMAPFSAYAAAGLGPIMTAHVVYPALDPDAPATASRPILTDELRGRLGFEGAVLTDDLEMGAVARIGGPSVAAVRALRAGADGLLVCRGRGAREAVIEAVAREARDDAAFRERLEEAVSRIDALRIQPTRAHGPEWIGSAEHALLRDGALEKLAAALVGRA
jgi:beta-N-acetylhexosaminidase